MQHLPLLLNTQMDSLELYNVSTTDTTNFEKAMLTYILTITSRLLNFVTSDELEEIHGIMDEMLNALNSNMVILKAKSGGTYNNALETFCSSDKYKLVNGEAPLGNGISMRNGVTINIKNILVVTEFIQDLVDHFQEHRTM